MVLQKVVGCALRAGVQYEAVHIKLRKQRGLRCCKPRWVVTLWVQIRRYDECALLVGTGDVCL
jgi:hypothetical protein